MIQKYVDLITLQEGALLQLWSFLVFILCIWFGLVRSLRLKWLLSSWKSGSFVPRNVAKCLIILVLSESSFVDGSSSRKQWVLLRQFGLSAKQQIVWLFKTLIKSRNLGHHVRLIELAKRRLVDCSVYTVGLLYSGYREFRLKSSSAFSRRCVENRLNERG